jgi:C-terminal processing protease CtpA/Prc
MMEELEKTLDSLPPAPESIFDQVKEEPQAEQPIQEQPVEVEKPNIEPEPGTSPSAKHFKAVRDLKERAERERDEAIKRAQELEARYGSVQSQYPQSLQEEQDEIKIGNDELAEGKHLKAVVNEVKKLKNELKQYQSHSSTTFIESRLKMEYPDIDKVVSKENIEILSMQYPEVAATINASPDLYNKAVSAYTLIKKLGIQPEDHYQEDRARAHINAAKPRPLTSVNPQQGDSPLSHANAFANGLTDELKSQLLKEMMNARR